ncbi:restriction endonuclease [Morganella morganii]|uniref:restriction endonuclease n=1 Tax=Morganella morganii TaxID=582 RepID=UPI003D7F643E
MVSYNNFEPLRFKDDHQFECFVKDYFEIKYNQGFAIYGRKGQRQKGIDIVYRSAGNNKIVIQCKNYNSTSFTTAVIDSDLEKSKEIQFNIDSFIFVTASKRDVVVIDHIKKINELSSFGVDIFFYEDIYSDTVNKYPELFQRYFPQTQNDIGADRHLLDVNQLEMIYKYTGVSCEYMSVLIERLPGTYYYAFSAFIDALDDLNDRYSGSIFYNDELQKYADEILEIIHKMSNCYLYYDFLPTQYESDYLLPRLIEQNIASFEAKASLENLSAELYRLYSNLLGYLKHSFPEFSLRRKF